MNPSTRLFLGAVAFYLLAAAAVALLVVVFAPGSPERGQEPTTTEARP